MQFCLLFSAWLISHAIFGFLFSTSWDNILFRYTDKNYIIRSEVGEKWKWISLKENDNGINLENDN